MNIFQISIVLLGVAPVVGWVINLVEVIQMTVDPITTLFVVKVIGIFFGPLGAIMGIFF